MEPARHFGDGNELVRAGVELMPDGMDIALGHRRRACEGRCIDQGRQGRAAGFGILGRADLGLTGTRDTAAVVRAVQRLRATRGVPRFCFVHVGGEPKPVGIDLDNPLAVDALVSLVLAGDSQEISVAEMRPAPDELWLRRRGGLTTSEFRIAMRRAR